MIGASPVVEGVISEVVEYAQRIRILGGKVMAKLAVLLVGLALSILANARDVYVKYRSDPVDVDNGHFQEQTLKSSSLVQHIFYDSGNEYLLVDLNGTYYHYCGIGSGVVASWVSAPSLGSFYSSNVKGRFDCRINPVPSYK